MYCAICNRNFRRPDGTWEKYHFMDMGRDYVHGRSVKSALCPCCAGYVKAQRLRRDWLTSQHGLTGG